MGMTELPSTAADSLGTDLTTKPGSTDGGESWRLRAPIVNKIRGYLIDLAAEVGLHDGSTPGSILARLAGLEGGSTRTTANKVRETSGPADLAVGAVADGQVLKRSGSSIVGAGAAPYELVWKWNQTDLSQFDQVGDVGFTFTVTTWGARNGTDDPTPAIRMDNPATASGFGALLIKASELPALSGNYQYFWTAQMQNNTALGTQDVLIIPYYESTTYFLALMRKVDGNYPVWTKREGSATYTDLAAASATQLGGGGGGRVFPFEFLTSPASAVQKPWIQGTGSRYDAGGVFNRVPAATRASYAASWQSLGSYAPRIGFGTRSYGTATAANGNCVTNIALYRVLS